MKVFRVNVLTTDGVSKGIEIQAETAVDASIAVSKLPYIKSVKSVDASISGAKNALTTASQGSTAKGGGYGPFTKKGPNWWEGERRNWTDSSLAEFVGGFSDFKVNGRLVKDAGFNSKGSTYKVTSAEVGKRFYEGSDKNEALKAFEQAQKKYPGKKINMTENDGYSTKYVR